MRIVLLLILTALTFQAQAEVFTIPVQSMTSALMAYSKQANRQVFFLPAAVLNKKNNEVIGNFDSDKALQLLLHSTDLIYKKGARGSISIVVRPPIDSASSTHNSIDEIIVRARKRYQDVQRVGVSVDVLTEVSIKHLHLSDTASLGSFSSNVNTSNISGATQPNIFIRGVGLNDTRINNTPPVGMYIDQVFLSSTALMGVPVFDMESIEILKGPQGTLYGRNTMAGTFNLFSKNPAKQFESHISAGVGNYHLKELEAVVSGPITTALQMRVAIQSRKRSGHQKNTFLQEYHGGVNTRLGRLTLAWQPKDRVDVIVKINASNNDSQGHNSNAIPTGDPAIIGGNGPASRELLRLLDNESLILDPELVTCQAAKQGYKAQAKLSCTDYLGNFGSGGDPDTGQWNVRPIIDNETLGVTSLVDWRTPSFLLSSITGMLSLSRERHDDRDGSVKRLLDSVFVNDMKQFSQELRLSAVSEAHLKWITGIFFSFDQHNSIERFDFSDNMGPTAKSESLFVPVTSYQQNTTSSAAFTHWEYPFDSMLNGIFGLRYTWEKKQFDGGSYILLEPGSLLDGKAAEMGLSTESDQNGILPLFGANACLFDGTQDCSDNFDAEGVSGRVGLDYMPKEQLLIYGSVSTGFKSGGFNGSIGLDPKVYEPVGEESIRAYEMGFKYRSNNKQWRVNTALFCYAYNDLQFKGNVLYNQSGFGFPYTELTSSGNARVIGGEVDVWWRPNGSLDIKAGISGIDFKIDSTAARLGKTQTYTPEQTANIVVRYEKNISDFIGMALSLDGSWQNEVFQDAQNSPILKQESYAIINANISVYDNNDRWVFAVWGKNINNKRYSQFGFNLLGGVFSLATEVPAIGSTYGIKLTYQIN